MQKSLRLWPALALLALAACRPVSGASALTPAEPDTLPIAAVQGRGERSPLEGQQVQVEGIVVRSTGGSDMLAAELRTAVGADAPPSGGWFVQDPGDGDPATSDALYVPDLFETLLITSADAPARFGSLIRVGDRIVVSGQVVELAYADADDRGDDEGHRVSLGAPGGSLTAIQAVSIEVLATPESGYALQPVAAGQEHSEAAEGMRLPTPAD